MGEYLNCTTKEDEGLSFHEQLPDWNRAEKSGKPALTGSE